MRRSYLLELALAAAVIVVAAVFGSQFDTGSLRDGVIRFCAVGLFAMSLNMLVGYTGLLSFGHAMFYGLGAYAFVLMMQSGAVGIPVAVLVSLIVAIAVATVIGLICIRLTGVYFAFLTLAFQMLFYSVLTVWVGVTGGEQGLVGGFPRPPFAGIDLGKPFPYFISNVVVFVVAVLILRRILTSPFGAALRLIRDNPQRAVFLGIDVFRTKLVAFVIASTLAALAGILMSIYIAGAYPNFAYWTMSGEGLFMIMLGGVNVFLGPAVGAALLLTLESVVIAHTTHQGIFIGSAILVTALVLKKGLLEFAVDWQRDRTGQRNAARGSALKSVDVGPLADAGERATRAGDGRQ